MFFLILHAVRNQKVITMFRPIYALFLRQIYLIQQSPPRLISYVFWPTIFMLIWGFLNQYLYQDTQLKKFTLSTFLGASLLLNVMERSNINIMMGFLEDVWSRNLGNILISPIKTYQLIAGIIINGFIGMAIGMTAAFFIAYLAFDFNIISLGLPVVAFFINLTLTGWAVGIMILGVIFLYGLSAEFIGWMAAFLMTPFVCVYYPVSILPNWLQPVSKALPPTHSFEGLRYLIDHGHFNWSYFYYGLALNILYLVVAVTVFVWAMNKARDKGGLLSMSE